MSAFEAQLKPFTIAIDREIQHEIDLHRGNQPRGMRQGLKHRDLD